MGRIFEELKRRNVIRVTAAYMVATWLVLQVADLVLENIAAPDWVMQVFMLMFALGFPLTLIFSWAYELTPEGLKRETDVDRDQSITGDTGRKLDMATIGMLVAVLLFVGYERSFVSEPGATAPVVATARAENSIAVLAFDDLSPEGDQAYFARGLSEELLNVLAHVDNLKVAGRTSSFAFQGQNKDLREIGELLNVAHILEGSVRKAGNRIRVTAQLIKASDGFHVFSETYDRDLSDIFAVQDEIAQSISSALLSEIAGAEPVANVTRTDPAAYELYLLARQRIHSRDQGEMEEALNMLGRALEIDPKYAPAIAQKALATYLLSDAFGAYGDTPRSEALPAAIELVEEALALDEQLAEAHAINGLLLDDQLMFDESIVAVKRALELNPTMSDAANWLSNSYAATNRRREGREILEQIVKRDPTYPPALGNLTMSYMRSADYDQADALITRVARIVGDNDATRISRGIVDVMRGDSADAVRELQPVYAGNPTRTVMKMWYGFALRGIADYETLTEVGLPENRMLALAAQGNIDDARRILYDLNVTSGAVARVLLDVGYFFNTTDSSQDFIEFVNEQYGSLDGLLQQFPVASQWGTGYLGQLAYAYLQAGDEATFRALMGEMHHAQDVQKEAGTDNWVSRYSRAEYAALNGDINEAIALLQVALDSGYGPALGLDSRVFDNLRDEPRFKEVENALARHVDEERAKLGMPPYRPLPTTEEREERSSFVN